MNENKYIYLLLIKQTLPYNLIGKIFNIVAITKLRFP